MSPRAARGDQYVRLGCAGARGPVDYACGPKHEEATVSAGSAPLLAALGISPGVVVWEIGVDDDADGELRDALEGAEGIELVDDDYDDVVDLVLLWWREDDGDLVDALVDAIGPLADHGVVWLLTPKPGRDGHVEAEDISDAAPTAGLQQTSTVSAGRDWQGTRLVAPRAGRR